MFCTFNLQTLCDKGGFKNNTNIGNIIQTLSCLNILSYLEEITDDHWNLSDPDLLVSLISFISIPIILT